MRNPGVLITGAAGEIGHALVERLSARGEAIVILDLKPLDSELLSHVDRSYVGSILDTALLDTILAEYRITTIYHLAALLSTRSEFTPVAAHQVNVWLVNTGWTGGSYGVGRRMSIDHTRAMLRAALAGKLEGVEMRDDPFFGLKVPTSCPEVPAGVLDPRSTWDNGRAYDEAARKLAGMFVENFEQYAGCVSPQVRAAGVSGSGR